MLLLLLLDLIITLFWNLSSHFLDLYESFSGGGVEVNGIKERLEAIGKSQVWLLKKLRENGIETQPPQLSNIINGIYTYPKAQTVLSECLKIIENAEKMSGTK